MPFTDLNTSTVDREREEIFVAEFFVWWMQARIVGTGHAVDLAGWHYIGTWQADGFVWHLFGPVARLT